MSKSHWTYQIVKYKDKSGFGLHEVYYNDDDEPWSMTSDPEVLNHLGPDIDGDPVTAEGLKQSMAVMLADAIRHDVLIEPEEWAECPFQKALDDIAEGKPGATVPYSTYDDLEHDGRREEEPDNE